LKLKIGVVCGEHSGDSLGACIVEELKKNNDVSLIGVGGPKLESLGLKSIFNFSELNVMGLVEPILHYRRLVKYRKTLIKLFIEKNIDIFIGIDSPDFNIAIHKSLKANTICKNVQLVSPSVWAWRQGRVNSIKKYIDLTLCLFNFEDNFFKKNNHNSLHVGHPFANLNPTDKEIIFKKYNLNSIKKYISILPGSRNSEIASMSKTYIDFIKEHCSINKNFFYLVPAVDKKSLITLQKLFYKEDLPVLIKENAIRDFLSISEFSIATSGTATLESAILGCPPIICYKTNALNYAIISRMLKVDKVGLPNLLLNEDIYIELIQNKFNVKNILKAIEAYKDKKMDNNKNIENLKNLLKGEGYSKAAKEIVSL